MSELLSLFCECRNVGKNVGLQQLSRLEEISDILLSCQHVMCPMSLFKVNITT